MKKCVILFIIINLFFATISSAEPNSDFLKTNSKNIIAIDRKTDVLTVFI